MSTWAEFAREPMSPAERSWLEMLGAVQVVNDRSARADRVHHAKASEFAAHAEAARINWTAQHGCVTTVSGGAVLAKTTQAAPPTTQTKDNDR